MVRKQFIRRHDKAYWLFGAVAIVLHLSLLLIPLHKTELLEPTPVLELQFISSQQAEPEQTVPESNIIEPATNDPPADNIPDPQGLPQAQQSTRIESHSNSHQILQPVLTTTALLKQLEGLEFPAAKPRTAKLGKSDIAPLPANLSEPVLAFVPTVFDEIYLPVETEILDQWQKHDGTTMVAMRTAQGQTVCGSMAAWDPVNPLFEPVLMYRLCSGGGRRKR